MRRRRPPLGTYGHLTDVDLRAVLERVGALDSPPEVAGCPDPSAAESRLQAAVALLDWIDQRGLSLDRLTHSDLELWVETYPLWQRAADLLRWAHGDTSPRL